MSLLLKWREEGISKNSGSLSSSNDNLKNSLLENNPKAIKESRDSTIVLLVIYIFDDIDLLNYILWAETHKISSKSQIAIGNTINYKKTLSLSLSLGYESYLPGLITTTTALNPWTSLNFVFILRCKGELKKELENLF